MTDDELRSKVLRLEDQQAILDRLYDYTHGINSRCRDRWLDVFTEDGVFAHRLSPTAPWRLEVRGRADLAAWFDQHADRWPLGSILNATVAPLVRTIDADMARAVSYYVLLRRNGENFSPAGAGIYADALVRCSDGKWRIRERRATNLPDPAASDPTRAGPVHRQ